MANEVFLTDLIQFGLGGINLQQAIDSIPNNQLARMTNVDRSEIGALRLRAGQELLAEAPNSTQFVIPSPESPSGPIDLVVREELRGMQFGTFGTFPMDLSIAKDVQNLGCTTVLFELPDKSQWTAFRRFVQGFNSLGIRVVASVGPSLLPTRTSSEWSTPGFQQEFALHVRQAAQQFGSWVRYWEIWPRANVEATALAAADLGNLMIAVFDHVRTFDATANILLGGLHDTTDQLSYLRTLYRSAAIVTRLNTQGTRPWTDVAMHLVRRDDPSAAVSRAVAFKGVMDQFQDALKRLWVTSFSFSSAAVSEQEQADFLDEGYRTFDTLQDPAHPGPTMVETLIWTRYTDGSGNDLVGVRSRDIVRPKPAYTAMQALGSPGEPLPEIAPTDPQAIDLPPGDVHSIGRLEDPTLAQFRRIFGIGQGLYHGISGTLTRLNIEFSGNPLHMVPARPPLSNETWMYVGDSRNDVKIRSTDGLMLDVGLDPAGNRALTEFDTIRQNIIGGFANAVWVKNVGSGGGVPSVSNVGLPNGQPGQASFFSTTKPASPADPDIGYFQHWGKRLRTDLSTFSDGTPSTDDDLIHLWGWVQEPSKIDELRVYLVLGIYDPRAMPGADTTDNHNAYVKSFRPSDFANWAEGLEAGISAATDASATQQSTQGLEEPEDELLIGISPVAAYLIAWLFEYLWNMPGTGWFLGFLLPILLFGISQAKDVRTEADEKRRGVPAESGAGKGQWTEFGVLGRPLRRGDFLRIGDDTTLGWGEITGLHVMVRVRSQADNSTFALGDFYLHGSSGVDNSEPGLSDYDWRYIHFDNRTGEKSNPSPIQTDAQKIDSPRRVIRVQPESHPRGSGVVQRFYRRGGTLTDDWYFVGANGTNGAAFFDRTSDADARTAGTLELDNDRPITTVDRVGQTLLDRALPSLWGPVSDMMMGCGDALSTGQVFWSKPGEYDHWPPQNNIEVTAPSEHLMTGGVYGSEPFVFSRLRLYRLLPVLTGETGIVNYVPTSCEKGPIERWCVAWSNYGIFFIADDGIYRTGGGPAESITDDVLEELFDGKERHGYDPVDITQRVYLRLETHENDLWFQYMDTKGVTRIFIYDLISRYWRNYEFAHQTASFYSEKISRESIMLLGGKANGRVYIHAGGLDDELPIVGRVRTGALDQGAPRRDKVYGDLSIDMDGSGSGTVDVTILSDNEKEVLTSVDITPTSPKAQELLDVLQSARKKNISIDLEWTDPTINVYFAAVQYLIDEAVKRIRWESEETTHGVPTHQTPLYANVAIRSTAQVTLQMTTYTQSGTSVIKTYLIPSTSGVKRIVFVPFEATLGIAFRYLFTSTAGFQVYREESDVVVRAFGGREHVAKGFGDSLAVSPSEIRSVRGQGMV